MGLERAGFLKGGGVLSLSLSGVWKSHFVQVFDFNPLTLQLKVQRMAGAR